MITWLNRHGGALMAGLALILPAQAQVAVVPGGGGTVDEPFQISQLGHLVWMAEHVDSSGGQYYVLQNNLDAAATSGWNGGEGFAPIGGDASLWFRGVFDGNGNVISNLSINRPNEGKVGLFGGIDDGAEVKNIGLANVSIAGSNQVGCLVGWNLGAVSGCYATGSVAVGHSQAGGLVGWNDGIITGCYSVVSVSGRMDVGGVAGLNYYPGAVTDCRAASSVVGSNYVGGLVGWNDSAVIRCQAMGSVRGKDDVGGLLGMNWTGPVDQCFAAGVVAGEDDVGGLAGENWTGTVARCYAVASVSGQRDVGGLMGENGGSISRCYAVGSVAGEDYEAGGLVGWNFGVIGESYAACTVTGGSDFGGLVGWNDGTVDNSYWDTQVSGLATSAGGTGKTTAQMKQPATFAGWNFTTVWGIVANETYPYLLEFGSGTVPVLSWNPTERAVGQAAGTTTFSVTNIGGGTLVYTASESESWLNIVSGGGGTNSGTIVISYLANTNAQARTGAITLSGGGFTGVCLVHQMGTAVPYAGVLESVLAPASLSAGQAYVVTTTVRNTGTSRWTAAIVGSSYYPSYKIIFRNMSWTNSGDQHIQQMMLHVDPGTTHTHSSTVDVRHLIPGSYSYVMECKYHNTEWTESYAAMSNSPRTNTFTVLPPVPDLPGTVEMENFNFGGQGVTYNDTTTTNEGGQYRPNEGVDIAADSAAGNGYAVGWTLAGEWMEYTVNVVSSGIYSVETRVAAVGTGGQFRILVNGTDKTGVLNVPNTGAWNVYQTVQKTNVNLSSGIQTVRVAMVTAGTSGFAGAFDWFRVVAPPPSGQQPYNQTYTPWAAPGGVEFEDFDRGGEAVAYHDATPTNQGGVYRTGEGVDIAADAAASNGFTVGWTLAGEWLEYTVEVPADGTYDLEIRVANSGAGATCRMLVDGADVTGTLAVPNTGGWSSYQLLRKTGLQLRAGTYVVRFEMVQTSSTGAVGAFDRWRLAPAGPLFGFNQGMVLNGSDRILGWGPFTNAIRIQHTPSLKPAVWSNVTGWITGQQYSIPSSSLKTTGFYRLEYQP